MKIRSKEKAMRMLENNDFSSADPKNKENYIFMLDDFSSRLRDDYEVMNLAIQKDPHNISYASKRLRNCEDLVILAVMVEGWTIKHAAKRLQQSKRIQDISKKIHLYRNKSNV